MTSNRNVNEPIEHSLTFFRHPQPPNHCTMASVIDSEMDIHVEGDLMYILGKTHMLLCTPFAINTC